VCSSIFFCSQPDKKGSQLKDSAVIRNVNAKNVRLISLGINKVILNLES